MRVFVIKSGPHCDVSSYRFRKHHSAIELQILHEEKKTCAYFIVHIRRLRHFVFEIGLNDMGVSLLQIYCDIGRSNDK